jgi:hypothetical protein
VLHWSPEDFWKSTFYEVSCGYIGHLRDKGSLDDKYQWSEDDVLAIEEMKQRFPDTKPGDV